MSDQKPVLMLLDLNSVLISDQAAGAKASRTNRRVEVPGSSYDDQVVRWVADGVVKFFGSIADSGVVEVAWLPFEEVDRSRIEETAAIAGLAQVRCRAAESGIQSTLDWVELGLSAREIRSEMLEGECLRSAAKFDRVVGVSPSFTDRAVHAVSAQSGGRALAVPVHPQRGLQCSDLRDISDFLGMRFSESTGTVFPYAPSIGSVAKALDLGQDLVGR